MTTIKVGIIDYGMGNHASVSNSLRKLGLRVSASADPKVLELTDILVLPGVGAFPIAMKELKKRGLVSLLKSRAEIDKPIIGICLGMQLLTSGSWEHEYTTGLDIIPGEIQPFIEGGWHIGWNTVEVAQEDLILNKCNGLNYYFNHSFHYNGPDQFKFGLTTYKRPFTSVIRKGNTIGLQFHPEKSQQSGLILLQSIVEGLANA